jgi:predicted hotdog family 3-hydroxylacyl-ACP dehydratase
MNDDDDDDIVCQLESSSTTVLVVRDHIPTQIMISLQIMAQMIWIHSSVYCREHDPVHNSDRSRNGENYYVI